MRSLYIITISFYVFKDIPRAAASQVLSLLILFRS